MRFFLFDIISEFYAENQNESIIRYLTFRLSRWWFYVSPFGLELIYRWLAGRLCVCVCMHMCVFVCWWKTIWKCMIEGTYVHNDWQHVYSLRLFEFFWFVVRCHKVFHTRARVDCYKTIKRAQQPWMVDSFPGISYISRQW